MDIGWRWRWRWDTRRDTRGRVRSREGRYATRHSAPWRCLKGHSFLYFGTRLLHVSICSATSVLSCSAFWRSTWREDLICHYAAGIYRRRVPRIPGQVRLRPATGGENDRKFEIPNPPRRPPQGKVKMPNVVIPVAFILRFETMASEEI